MMHGPINVKSPNNTSKWQMGFNSAFKGLSFVESNAQKSSKHMWRYFSVKARRFKIMFAAYSRF
jgi:hypothetical protein